MNLTRAEIEQRIEADPGDPEDKVYALRSRGRQCYHDSTDCRQLKRNTEHDADGSESFVTLDRTTAQLKRLGPCKICVIDHITDSTDRPFSLPRERYANLIERDQQQRASESPSEQ